MNPAPPHPVVLKTPVSNGTVVVSNPQYTTTVQRRKEPRKTYITVLPGRPRPVFVRDRKKPFTLGFGCGFSAIAAAFAPPPIRRSYSAGPIRTEVRVTSATAQPIRVTSATAQPIRVTSAPAQPIRVTSAPAQPIRVTSAPAQPTVLTTEQPANIYPASHFLRHPELVIPAEGVPLMPRLRVVLATPMRSYCNIRALLAESFDRQVTTAGTL
ncbi:MAG: hypothetical protein FRX48_01149 [Lasallia pustulata]|uniref:Uncharacterized protein n=1 Tax=Lasallia pustulata TaxID=136370 RepID=A0A5M8PZA9_9LECA|nr:MAG: hypothetical protein FRX48_01149 [Lasallia pustulata]